MRGQPLYCRGLLRGAPTIPPPAARSALALLPQPGQESARRGHALRHRTSRSAPVSLARIGEWALAACSAHLLARLAPPRLETSPPAWRVDPGLRSPLWPLQTLRPPRPPASTRQRTRRASRTGSFPARGAVRGSSRELLSASAGGALSYGLRVSRARGSLRASSISAPEREYPPWRPLALWQAVYPPAWCKS